MGQKAKFSREEQQTILLDFFNACVRYWERTLKIDSDLEKQAHINALEEIPTHDPRVPFNPPSFDEDVLEDFVKARYMDTYGRDWQRYYALRKH